MGAGGGWRVVGGHYGELDTAAFHPGWTSHSRHGGHGGPAHPPPTTPPATTTAAATTTRPHTGGVSRTANGSSPNLDIAFSELRPLTERRRNH